MICLSHDLQASVFLILIMGTIHIEKKEHPLNGIKIPESDLVHQIIDTLGVQAEKI